MKHTPFLPGHYYHIFNRGNNKENIFRETRNYHYFLKLMNIYLLPISKIFSYCLLRNHFHILLQIKQTEDLPESYKSKLNIFQAFSNMFNEYTKAINKAYHRTGSLFQEHLHRLIIKDEKYLKQLIIYVHLNPEKHGFIDKYSNYKFSSYNSFISKKETNLDREYVIELFEDKQNYMFCHNERNLKRIELIDKIEEIDFF